MRMGGRKNNIKVRKEGNRNSEKLDRKCGE
jgi:hypothetical protein